MSRDQMGNYIPNQQSYESEGILKTGQIFLFNEDQQALNIAGNILLTGGLTLGVAAINTNAASSMIRNFDQGVGALGSKPHLQTLGYKKTFAKAQKGGGLATFIMPDNLLSQGLQRQMFEDASLFKKRSFFNPLKHFESATAQLSASINALSSGHNMAYLKVADRASYNKVLRSAGKIAEKRAMAKSAVKWGVAKGAGFAAANLASRALSFQEILLPGQVANLFMGGDFGGIFQSIGHEAAQKQNSNRTLATMSYGFHDNGGAATMRQRSLNAIHNSQARLQQVFGMEATHVHS